MDYGYGTCTKDGWVRQLKVGVNKIYEGRF